MLVWDESGEMPNLFTVAGVAERRVSLCAYESYVSSVNRIILRDRDHFDFVPHKLSAAMIGAFRALGGRVADSVETSYAPPPVRRRPLPGVLVPRRSSRQP